MSFEDEEELLPRSGCDVYDMKKEEDEIRQRRLEESSIQMISGSPIENYVMFVKENLVRFTRNPSVLSARNTSHIFQKQTKISTQ